MMLQIPTLAVTCCCGAATAHMLLQYPPALRYEGNPYAGSNVDYSLTSPLSSSGSDYPCKGSLSLLGTSQATPVATWTPGSTVNMTISGGAPHNGGSCQASISTDGGKTFTVVHSWIGSCPAVAPSSSFSFRVPSDVPSSDKAVFAWTWFNNEGNREMYMNCAAVTIDGGDGGKRSAARSAETVAFAGRPDIFTANIGNGCSTVASANVLFPQPGPDVDANDPKAVPPTGTCQAPKAVAASGSGPGSGSGSNSGPEGGSSDSSLTGFTIGASKPSATSSSGDSIPSYRPGDNFPEDYSGSGCRARCTLTVFAATSVVVLLALAA